MTPAEQVVVAARALVAALTIPPEDGSDLMRLESVRHWALALRDALSRLDATTEKACPRCASEAVSERTVDTSGDLCQHKWHDATGSVGSS